ncbi:MAG TPA: hypothetical protein PLM75_01445 [bacterium]|nr:hypothetical protein [bacterium]
MKKLMLTFCLIAVLISSANAGSWFSSDRLDMTVRGNFEVNTTTSFKSYAGVGALELVFDRISQLDKLMKFGNIQLKPYLGMYLFSAYLFYNADTKKYNTSLGGYFNVFYSGLNIEYKVDKKSRIVVGLEKSLNDYYSHSIKLGYKYADYTSGVKINNVGLSSSMGMYVSYDIYKLKYKY